MARDGSKIDVQFIEKNTVLFRIENAILRDKVIQRRYWHIADVPLVVREWSPESALDPLDLSAMPMWIDLKGVSNLLFSCKGLKCLSRAAGKYVKLHPNTERCTWLDVARVLVEVNLQKPLVEKIYFTNQEGQKVDIEVKYPWLPPRCTAENVAAVSTEAGGNGLKKNAVADLLRDLECFYPILQEGGSGHKGTVTNVEFSVGEVNLEKMIVQENTEERGQEITVQKETEWAVINGGPRSSPISDMVNGEASSSSVSATETVVSPSRFTVLTTLDEDIEDTEVEEGEVVSENEHIGIADSERPKDKEEHRNRLPRAPSSMGSSHPPEIELPTPVPPVSTTTASSSPRRASGPWSKGPVADFQPLIDITDGVASIQIPNEIYANPEPFWRSFVVGHFIGDPHVGSIHATVNRIWTMARDGSKIDVQFIEKNTVLFRIENAILREKVIQRRYWHVADILLVVREWSPETALDPLDLSKMPIWIDLKGVPNLLFSRKGLKCLSRAAGKYVKLHPKTERCTRLDVALKYPWLTPRCTVCHGWGHKGSDCVGSNVVILSKDNEAPQAENVAAVSTEAGGNGLKKNAVSDLLRDLECLDPILQERGSGHKGTETNVEFSVGEVNLEKMIVQENTEERGQEITVQKETDWAVINRGPRSSPISDMVNGEASSSSVSATETVVSPSRFTVLATLDEDIEDTEVEEGEVVSEDEHVGIADSEQPKDKGEHRNRRGKSVSVAAQKSTKKKVIRSRDLNQIINLHFRRMWARDWNSSSREWYMYGHITYPLSWAPFDY
ncbi:hypothetical protein F2Q68_00004936 [Brassica cretica]|uniref:DUF4283 domain-containing protein n=1 Tax=Brassica cretica TaxID=69181 RepID=A0A8S9JFI8_BRACR|nr:hypothetical protein F2Q68_00004936 [Brassica cretica]